MSGRAKKLEITEQELKQAEDYAFAGNQNNTICTLMGWNHNFLDDRPDSVAHGAARYALLEREKERKP